ncbi:MAG: hypothetical protein J6J24_01435 [Clostridia bacterium]|nr:hypothetical protein [Clostridia bacterium]
METEILEKEIAESVEKNQISFDFLQENPKTQTVVSAESFDWVAEETLVIIVRAEENFSAEFSICGKKMIDWVSLSCHICQTKIIEQPKEEDFLETIRNCGEGFKYVAVLYSDTPLLKKSTFLEIMKLFSSRDMNVMKLKRGFVFKAEFLKTATVILSAAVEDFGEDDFLVVDNSAKLSYAFAILNGRILSYHRQNGVVMFGENTIFIDADVEIEKGAIIYPNNIIKGESYIGKNAILESGNFIVDTIVCDEAFVCQSYLEESKVESSKVVGPFAKLINQKI